MLVIFAAAFTFSERDILPVNINGTRNTLVAKKKKKKKIMLLRISPRLKAYVVAKRKGGQICIPIRNPMIK